MMGASTFQNKLWIIMTLLSAIPFHSKSKPPRSIQLLCGMCSKNVGGLDLSHQTQTSRPRTSGRYVRRSIFENGDVCDVRVSHLFVYAANTCPPTIIQSIVICVVMRHIVVKSDHYRTLLVISLCGRLR